MRAIALIALLVTSSPPVPPHSWRELYDRGEFRGAAALLHSAWNEMMKEAPAGIEIDVVETLGRLYLEGRGVEADVALACSYFELAVAEASGRHSDEQKTVVLRTTELRDRACRQLSAEARREATDSLGCPRFGPDVHTFSLSAERQVQVDRYSIRIQHGEHRHEQPAPIACGGRLALVRHTRVDGDRAKSQVDRDFLEAFVWTPGSRAGHRALNWFVTEIVDTKATDGNGAELGERPGATWEPPEIPAELLAVTFSRLKDGDISWRFEHAPFNGRLSALDVEIAPEATGAPSPLPSSGDERLEVQVTDRFGAALVGVDVRLEGVVTRSALTDQLGVAAFEQLPHGRYDVVAAAKGFAPNHPRVLDLPETQDRVTLTLKPSAPTSLLSIACGMMGALTLESLGAKTDLLLHIRVTGQTAAESEDSQGIVTTNRARVLEVLKSSGASPAAVTIAQPGGTIDRGDVILTHVSHNLPPLNVGDEYVVFLRRQESGQLALAHFEESVFLIRNGRVYPAGKGRVAVAWKERSAERFFDALRARVR